MQPLAEVALELQSAVPAVLCWDSAAVAMRWLPAAAAVAGVQSSLSGHHCAEWCRVCLGWPRLETPQDPKPHCSHCRPNPAHLQIIIWTWGHLLQYPGTSLCWVTVPIS